MKHACIAGALAFALLGAAGAALAAGGDAEAGRAKTQICQACHGPDGNSPDPQFPKLAGQHADYLAQTLARYKSGVRPNPIMAAFAAALSEQDQRDIAAFYASQANGVRVVERE